MQVLRAVTVTQAFEALAELCFGPRSHEQGPHQRPQVKACATDEYRGVIARFNLSHHSPCEASPISGREILGGLDDVDQVMRYSLAFGLGDFCCCNVYSFVDLDGIQVDDLAGARKGQFDAKLALARSSGTDDCGDDSHIWMLASRAEECYVSLAPIWVSI